MSFLSRLFGSRESTSGAKDVEGRLRRLEEEAATAVAGYVGTSFNKAGDLALKDGQADRALGYYGRAIDAFLEDAQREAARGVANKIIRVRPSAIRTLCTLTWLDLAARHTATALLHLRDYVEGAKEAAQHARAATQIFEMARLAPEPEFVNAVADALDSLDFSRRAEEVRGWARDGSPGALEDADLLSEACLYAAVRSNDRDAELLRDSDHDTESQAEASGSADEEGVDATDSDEAEVDASDSDEAEVDASDSDEAEAEASEEEEESEDAGEAVAEDEEATEPAAEDGEAVGAELGNGEDADPDTPSEEAAARGKEEEQQPQQRKKKKKKKGKKKRRK